MNQKNVNQIFQKAVKNKSKLRLAVFGPSGSGKTFSAMRIAAGLGQRIAVLDTEFGSASKYADQFEFDVCNLENADIDNYINVIENASDYDVLIIDSMTHGWQELLEEIDKLAKTKYSGNTWSAWNEGTPKQKKLVRAILNSKCHIIATMRSKTEWTTNKDEKTGKLKPTRVGLTPEQGKGIEYEFDMLIEINPEHFATVIKDRTGKFQDKIIEKPDEKFGKALHDWLNTGEDIKENEVMVNLRERIISANSDNELKIIGGEIAEAAEAGRLREYEVSELRNYYADRKERLKKVKKIG